MAKDDFYKALLGVPIDPPTSPLSQLLGLEPPPAPASNHGLSPLSTLLGRSVFQPLPSTPTGLRFQERFFSEPISLAYASLSAGPGIYAIVVIDGTWQPRPYRPIYFGKAIDLAERVGVSHEKYDEWCRAAGGAEKLYFAHHIMYGSSEQDRAAAEEDLIRHYSPHCNITFNYFANLLGY